MRIVVVKINIRKLCKSRIIKEEFVETDEQAKQIKKQYKGKNILCLLVHAALPF